ncbi:MAG: hypothetical protein ACI8ZO_001458, partial [Flavobacteriales bacterium]
LILGTWDVDSVYSSETVNGTLEDEEGTALENSSFIFNADGNLYVNFEGNLDTSSFDVSGNNITIDADEDALVNIVKLTSSIMELSFSDTDTSGGNTTVYEEKIFFSK